MLGFSKTLIMLLLAAREITELKTASSLRDVTDKSVSPDLKKKTFYIHAKSNSKDEYLKMSSITSAWLNKKYMICVMTD